MEAKDTVISVSDIYEKGRKAGRREVVEWIRKANHSGDFFYSFDQAELQDQIKEWGIDEKHND